MKRQFSACQTPRSMYLSIFNSFPVIRTESAKNRRFYVPQPTFLFPLETPLRLSRSCMDGKAIQCLLNPSQQVPIYFEYFPSYTMLKSMRKSKSRYFYHILVSPGDSPGAITLNVVCIERECAHLSITVSEIERDIGRKTSFFHTTFTFDAPVNGVSVGIAPPCFVCVRFLDIVGIFLYTICDLDTVWNRCERTLIASSCYVTYPGGRGLPGRRLTSAS